MWATLCSFTTPKEKIKAANVDLNYDKNWQHLLALDSIAKANNNNRAVGTPGGIATKEYILHCTKLLGIKPTLQTFTNRRGEAATNIIIDIKGKSDEVIMLGTHYDAIAGSPSINTSGTGVATLLELMRYLQQQKKGLKRSFRIVFWDSKEVRLDGSSHYIKQTTDAQISKLKAYINVHTVGTQQSTKLIIDGDNSSFVRMKNAFMQNDKRMSDYQADSVINVMIAYSPKQIPTAKLLEQKMSAVMEKNQLIYYDDYHRILESDAFHFIGLTNVTGLLFVNFKSLPNGSYLIAPCYNLPCDDINNVDRPTFNQAYMIMKDLVDDLNK